MTEHDTRLLIVLPSWVGDAVMATPALVRIRRALPGAFIGGLARPGIDRLLEGLTTPEGHTVIDEFHIGRPTGVLGPKFTAAKIRPRRYTAALLLTGSFSTALTARIAGIPRRVGYDRDARGFLLTHRLRPPRAGSKWAVIPAVSYYWHAAAALLDPSTPPEPDAPALHDLRRVETGLPPGVTMTLPVSPRDEREADAVRTVLGLSPDEPTAVLNPGGNNPAKRWPPDRFAALADHLAGAHGLTVLVNGSPAEAELCASIVRQARTGRVHALPGTGHTIGSLKALCRDARLMVTNDTGPRHIAAALGCPLVSLFGPTDPRWTTIPVRTLAGGSPAETILVADESLPVDQIANDHPDRCRIDRITLDAVTRAADTLLAAVDADRPQE
ncbi:MAG TPA: glycosyltransferase family 9 protein [Phycisphaerales bacterium]|nr:glycosyltransferase family 9 protein [Phycisphaerales bacterium]